MAIHALSDLTWEEARDLARDGAVAVLPVGAVEAHGPHLPLATDVIIAEAMARAGAARLDARGYQAVIFPAVAYTPAPYAAAFAGTVTIRGESLATLVADVAASAHADGFRVLAIANAHLDPANIDAIATAVEQTRAASEDLRIAFPDVTRKPWAPRLTEEFRSGACHAGRYETSIVLAERPELVRTAIQRDLAPNPASLTTAIRDGKRSFEDAGGPAAYFGYPADATAAEGYASVAALGSILEEAVAMVLEDDTRG